MSKTIEEIRAELDANIPRSAIEEREGGFGKKLSYLSGWYVIDRLNKVLGQGRWSYQLRELTKTFEGEVNGKQYVSYIAKVSLSATLANIETKMGSYPEEVEFIDVGFGDGQDKVNPGKAHELAVKEAVTDGIKRCAKSLGMSMGLALYDKTQEFVNEEETTYEPKTKTIVVPKVLDPGPAVGSKAVTSVDETKNQIKTYFAQLLAKQAVKSQAEFKSKYGFESVSKLNEAAAIDLLAKIKHDYGTQLNLN